MSSFKNLLFVFADQMRAFDMGCAGNSEIRTPNFDRLAGAGVNFTHALVNSPVCTPSRGTILTGRYPIRHGAVANDLPLGDCRTVADVLKEQGYSTGYIGKWHLDGIPRDKFTPPGARRRGFDYWAAYNCSHEYFREDKYYLDSPVPEQVSGYEPEVQTDLAREFLRENRDGPFALYLSWGPPHDPYPDVPERYRELYRESGITARPNVEVPGRTAMARRLDYDRSIADYYAAISALDTEMGRLLDCLEDLGLAESTLVVFTSDHGDMLWSHGMLKKQVPWDEAVRVPLLMRLPGVIAPGSQSAALASAVDLVPTVLEFLGVEHDGQDMDGSSLTPCLAGDGGPESVLLMDLMKADESADQDIPEWRAIRTRDYLYAETVGRAPWMLFDLDQDPFQMRNVVDMPGYAEIQADLVRILGSKLKDARDPFVPGVQLVERMGLGPLWRERERVQSGAVATGGGSGASDARIAFAASDG
ncbi:sulfatase [Ruania alkalisoli]|uniref:Sulfatase n=1 Tax=Ruania alkalisoli TaxID=2779775 RepID=A0A7M1SSP3_9MICO|nr:sulfatase [Ruania alkalisoli]QOR70570.1 sulfatase [Ruania alkalisoli]